MTTRTIQPSELRHSILDFIKKGMEESFFNDVHNLIPKSYDNISNEGILSMFKDYVSFIDHQRVAIDRLNDADIVFFVQFCTKLGQNRLRMANPDYDGKYDIYSFYFGENEELVLVPY